MTMASSVTTEEYYLDAIRNANVKQITKENYMFIIRRIKQITQQNIDEFMKTPQTTYNKLIQGIKDEATGMANNKTLKLMIATVLAIMKHSDTKKTNKVLYSKWYTLYMAVSKNVDEEEKSSVATGRLKNGFILWEEISQTRDILERKAYASQDHLILSMYTYLPPRRQEDYYRVEVVQTVDQDLDSDISGRIRMDQQPVAMEIYLYKTAKSYNDWLVELPLDLLTIIRASLTRQPRRYLFVQQNGEPYKSYTQFRKMTNRVFKRLFGEHVTLNSIRHAGAQQNLLNARKSMSEQHKYAEGMGHKYDTHQRYRKIVPDNYKMRDITEESVKLKWSKK